MYSYHKAKQEPLKASDPYRLGGEWNELIKRNRKEYLKALNNHDFKLLSKHLVGISKIPVQWYFYMRGQLVGFLGRIVREYA